MPLPSFTQLDTVVNPVIIGFSPVPYAPITIGLETVPDFEGMIVPEKLSPLLNKTESPASRLLKNEFNFEIDFHGVSGFFACSAVLVSSPFVLEK